MIPHINKLQDKNQAIISKKTVTAYDKSQYNFTAHSLSKLGRGGKFLYLIKGISPNPTANISFSGVKGNVQDV